MSGNKELTLYEFKMLSDHEQYDLLFTKGEFLDVHLEVNSRFALYALFKFFVEIEYDSVNNKIVNKVSFISGKKLDRYSNFRT